MAVRASGGGEAPAHVAAGVTYVELVLNLKNGVRLCRRKCIAASETVLGAVAAVSASAAGVFGSEVATVSVSACTAEKFDKVWQREVTFTNICGKVLHCAAAHTIQPGVLPLVVHIDNGFGRFFALYGPNCNLQTSSTKTVTIFRAARRSRDVCVAIEHALTPESIIEVTVHMIVASARVSHPICLQCDYMDAVFRDDPRWTAHTVVKTEEGAHMKSIRIFDVSAAWVGSLGHGLRVPTNIMVNITKNGGVNVFMSIDDAFCEDVELKYVPIYEAIVAVVERYT